MKNRLTAAVATLALLVGASSAVGGVLNERAADRKVCASRVETNKAVRNLLDDFITQNPKITQSEKAKSDAIALRRFPPHC